MNASPAKTTREQRESSLTASSSCYSSPPETASAPLSPPPSSLPPPLPEESSPSSSRFSPSSPEETTTTASSSYFASLTSHPGSGRQITSKFLGETEDKSEGRLFVSHGDRFDNSFSISVSSPYTPVTSVLGFREMRRHCPPMSGTSHPSQTTANIFPSLEAELHDLSSRNHSNIKPDVSSMYHHHVMQRQHHPSEMHDFLSGDPMSASLPVALAAASDPSHHSVSSSGGQIHTPSSLYGSHPHHPNVNGMNSKLQAEEAASVHAAVSYEPFLVNGMTLSGLHHHHHATQISAASAAAHQMQSFHHPHHHPSHHHTFSSSPPHHNPPDPSSLIDADPRELEAFAEKFKQRRIKLGVTQADVGRALANLKLPGVGSLSQSTICRFESLTLSHNNMVALKPILQAWLEAAEAQARKNRIGSRGDPLDLVNVLPSSDKKRKRTSIAAPEKRSLEAYFAVQPRPSGEKIAAIAEKLDLKKNVVRVWFCNQRQKQKRMKYSAANQPNMS